MKMTKTASPTQKPMTMESEMSEGRENLIKDHCLRLNKLNPFICYPPSVFNILIPPSGGAQESKVYNYTIKVIHQ